MTELLNQNRIDTTLSTCFLDPPNEYRDVVLWSWNDDLDDLELIRQVDELSEKGFGGFFLFSFYGLVTRYLSKDWMRKVRVVLDRAREAGLDVWIYDEDRFPSGHAGGYVALQSDDYRQRLLECAETSDGSDGPEKNVLTKYTHNGKSYDIFTLKPPSHTFYNNSTYTDLMNPEAVDCFLKRTHEAYYEEFGEYFGTTIKGFFTDEPNVLHAEGYSCDERMPTPWTDQLPNYFARRYGYDIQEHLPSLFFRVGDYRRIRTDFWMTVNELFVTNYTKRLHDWCKRHGVILTGHMVYEDNMARQTPYIGSAMPHYEFFDIPGGDHLGKKAIFDTTYAIPDQEVKPLNLLPAIKQPASVAHQLGKSRIFTEIYGAAGWDLSLSEQKWVGDWDCLLGANFRSPHLYAYSLRGQRKRSFPPSLFYQQPWWQDAKILTDYFARLSYLTSQGDYAADIMVLYPAESGWSSYAPSDTSEVEKLDSQLEDVSDALMKVHRSYDYAHPTLLRKYGRIEEDQFIVGQSSYSVVIIPPGISLLESSLDLLISFMESGGRVIAIGPFPNLLDGSESSKILDFFGRSDLMVAKSTHSEDIKSCLDSIFSEEIIINDHDGQNIGSIWCQHRIMDDRELYFMLNCNQESPIDAVVEIPHDGVVERWDAVNGQVDVLLHECVEGGSRFSLSFNPGESHLIQVDRTRQFNSSEKVCVKYESCSSISLGNEWTFRRTDPNALVLDFCKYQIDGKGWSDLVPVHEAEKIIKEHYQIPQPGPAFGLQPWKEYENLKSLPSEAHIALAYSFDVAIEDIDGREFLLILETPDEFEINVNGNRISNKDCGWWIDPSFRKIDLSRRIRRGQNQVELSCRYRQDIELESCYIAGDFAVQQDEDNKFVLLDEPASLHCGDWVKQGYPCYSGEMSYLMEIDCVRVDGASYTLDLPELHAMSVHVMVNGNDAGVVAWKPYSLDISQWIVNGINKIEIRLATSLRNLLGPHHHIAGELTPVAPNAFSEEDEWADRYCFVSYGLFDEVKLAVCNNRQ